MQDEIVKNLKKSGLKITSVRKRILEILKTSAKPLTVHEVLSEIEANKTTIYREIDTLLRAGYLDEVDFGDRNKRYELLSLGHHHHLICVRCHKVEDVVLKETLFNEEELISHANNFKVLHHSLEFFGYCHNCQ
jgi:Fe2+ or Zn2+ uptake regulation protein